MGRDQPVDPREQVFHLRIAQSILGLAHVQLVEPAATLADEIAEGRVGAGHVVVDPRRPALVAVEANREDDGMLCKVAPEDPLQVPQRLALAPGEALSQNEVG